MAKTAFIGPRLRNGRTRTNVKRTAKKALATKSYVKKAINANEETKMISFTTVPTLIGPGGIINDYSSTIISGFNERTRVGAKVKMVNFNLIYSLNSVPVAPPAYVQFVRVIFLQDMNDNLSVLNLTDVLSTATWDSPYSPQENLLPRRFKILHDRIHTLYPNPLSAPGTSYMDQDFVVRLNKYNLGTVIYQGGFAVKGRIMSIVLSSGILSDAQYVEHGQLQWKDA